MTFSCFNTKSLCLTICGLVGVWGLSGCGSKDYKQDADERVYKIIDQKWQSDFGSKSNYKISDTTPSPNDVQIERAVPASGILTLPQAVALATAYNREYQTQKEALYIKALDLRLFRHNFEMQFFGSGTAGYTKLRGREGLHIASGTPDFGQLSSNPDGIESVDFDIKDVDVDGNHVTIKGMDFDRKVDDVDRIDFGGDMIDAHGGGGSGIGFNQLLSTGAVISSNIAISWIRILTGNLEGGLLTSVLSASVTQPLLRGSDRKVVLENLTQAEKDTLYQVRSFNRFRKTFVVSTISQYYLVLQQYDAMRYAQRNYNTLKWLYDKVDLLAKAGRLPKEEQEQARQETLQALDIYILAEKEYKQALDEFKITLGLPTTAEFQLDTNEIDSLKTKEMTYPLFSENEAIKTALARRLDLVNSADAIYDAQRKVFVAADSLRAQLDLGAKVNIPLQDISSSNTKILQDLYLYGLQADLPFDRVAEQNIYRKALIALNQREREYELAKDTVTLEIRQAYRDLKEAAQRYHVQTEALKLAEKRLKNTFLLLQCGRASSRRVLRAQVDLLGTQNTATEALVNYMIATLSFYRDTEVLQVRPDGMWQRPGSSTYTTKLQQVAVTR